MSNWLTMYEKVEKSFPTKSREQKADAATHLLRSMTVVKREGVPDMEEYKEVWDYLFLDLLEQQPANFDNWMERD